MGLRRYKCRGLGFDGETTRVRVREKRVWAVRVFVVWAFGFKVWAR